MEAAIINYGIVDLTKSLETKLNQLISDFELENKCEVFPVLEDNRMIRLSAKED